MRFALTYFTNNVKNDKIKTNQRSFYGKGQPEFYDWTVKDIADTIEIKGVVEATCDENGEVDNWAVGLTMELGYIFDDEIATLAGISEDKSPLSAR